LFDRAIYEKFAAMIARNWEAIAAHSQPTHDIPLGFVVGLNNKIRVIQRRAYGLRDAEYPKLKIQKTHYACKYVSNVHDFSRL
jgi:transposase